MHYSRTALFFTFIGFFLLTYLFLAMMDSLPETTQSAPATEQVVETQVPVVSEVVESPVRIAVKKIGLNVTIENPTSTNIEVLDAALLKGAVRYPTSAQLGQEGTMLLFGHSSYLPIVNNKNFKAFDDIQNLVAGDSVSVYSAGKEYRYSVTGMRKAKAEEDSVELLATGKHLALVTCNSFGTKSDRFVVTADLSGVYEISN